MNSNKYKKTVMSLSVASLLMAATGLVAESAKTPPSSKNNSAPAQGKAGVAQSLVQAAAAVIEPDFRSDFIAVGFSRNTPAFSYFSVDSLGYGKVQVSPALVPTNALPFAGRRGWGKFIYRASGKTSAWKAKCAGKIVTLSSVYVPGTEVPPFVLNINQRANHATLLGMIQPDERKISIPCVLHMPDMGSLRITCNVPGWKLDYDALRRIVNPPFVRVSFPPATAEHPDVVYTLEAVAIYPKIPGIENDSRFDGFRRNYLSIFQVNPRMQMLANNSSSDPCSMCLFEYADVAIHAPPLAEGLTCMDLIRMTLDRYLSGVKGYGQVGYGPNKSGAVLVGWGTPWTTLDTYPSFLISACEYVRVSGDTKWGRANYEKLLEWAKEMMAADKDGNGLVEYPATGNYGDRPTNKTRPANWWDTINFGHEDAFSNALTYRACRLFAEMAAKLEHTEDARFFTAKADALHAAYAKNLLNPETGMIAGWKSADGQLHDYWFTFVQGIAVSYGLLDDKTANSVMDKLLAKIKEVGYTDFTIGLPGNLVPIKKGDYINHNSGPQIFGVPRREDGSDGFQYYENGGATGCWAYFTIHALYKLGRVDEARAIFFPLMKGYAEGNFQGFSEKGGSRDWRDWKGVGRGYEGMLTDSYHAMISVFDEAKEGKHP
ncbi:MAG: hypothetical protein WCP12_14285 [bacterium]